VPYTPAYVLPPEDPPAVVAERELAACATIEELHHARERITARGRLTANEISALYEPHGERVETRRLDDLIARINGRSEAQLHEQFLDEVRALTAQGVHFEYSDMEISTLMSVASLMNAVANWDRMTRHLFRQWNDERPFYSILARRRLQVLDGEDAQAALRAIEPLEQAEPKAFARFLFEHYRQKEAVDAVARVTRTQRQELVFFIQNYRDWPIGIAAKKRYQELLDQEYAQMVGWDRFLYWLFRRDRDRDI